MKLLSQLQKEIIEIFSTIPGNENFYLTGGTALSVFYLNHRRSNDLDFFTKTEEIVLPFSYRFENSIKSKGIDVERQRMVHSFIELVAKKEDEIVVVHLAQDSPFRFEEPKEFPEFPGVKVDSIIDIATNKLLALFGRATLRDFIDIYFLVKKGKFTTEELMDKAKLKDPGFDLYWLGVALERINIFQKDSPEMLLLVEPVDFEELSNFFNSWRQKLTKRLL